MTKGSRSNERAMCPSMREDDGLAPGGPGPIDLARYDADDTEEGDDQ